MTQEKLLNKWNRRYTDATNSGSPSSILALNTQLIPQQGTALDLACGLGANSLYLASLNLDTHAWDISPVALERLKQFALQQKLSITTEVRDIEKNPPKEASFDVIVVSNFLYRPICGAISDALKPGGLLFYQTFLLDKKNAVGPSSSKYLLAQNELLALFPKLVILAYQEIGSYPQRIVPTFEELDSDTAILIGRKPV